MQARVEDFPNRDIVEIRTQPSGETLCLIPVAAFVYSRDTVQGGIQRIDAVTDGARKLAMGDKKLRHLPRSDLADVKLAIGLQRAHRLEHRHPLNRIDISANLLAGRQKDVIFDVEDARGGVGSLEQASDPDEIPAFAMSHGRVRDALKEMRAKN